MAVRVGVDYSYDPQARRADGGDDGQFGRADERIHFDAPGMGRCEGVQRGGLAATDVGLSQLGRPAGARTPRRAGLRGAAEPAAAAAGMGHEGIIGPGRGARKAA
ncbi:hypothetical protein GCM10010324_28110 [Streptomyces hiroshimensis]|uniref:Uncharacterized protein n=1 Tax=Streptomyces hiroshimensis TaxID=66424 RepID=A0ABQ2YGN0_9ACTN|nr:hypothetical protein GCM10010324_28110 [Streptomyces hiroshimensis]